MRQALVVFSSYHFAANSDTLLTQAKVKHTLIPTPLQIGSFCGLCLLVDLAEVRQILALFRDNKISVGGLYEQCDEKWQRVSLLPYIEFTEE